MPIKLTPKQAAFFAYIERALRETGELPTYRRVMEDFGFSSPNSVTQNLAALEKKGYLRRAGGGWHLAGRRCSHCGAPLPSTAPCQAEGPAAPTND